VSLEQARSWIKRAQSIIGFTGAGISTESGIPDFRSSDGVWARNRTIDFDEFVRDKSSRIEAWRQKVAIWHEMREAEPNSGHMAFVELARLGKLKSMITQNIDGLHQRSGLTSAMVLELHGTTLEVMCLSCRYRIPMDEAVDRIKAGEQAPVCHHCGGILKTATVSFGQAMPQDVVRKAENAAVSCELFLAVGSSLVVHPAAGLPLMAKRAGARLIIVNRAATPLDKIADLVVNDEIGKVLPKMVEIS
jgi:NAD-dependent deacetylase